MATTTNNSSSALPATSCQNTQIEESIKLIAYTIIPVFYDIFGIIGHLIAAITFYHQCKTESPYVYQFFLAVSKAAETLFLGTYILCQYHWSGYDGKHEADWFVNSYQLMFYAAKIGPMACSVCASISPLISMFMAVDRIWALKQPIAYRNARRKRTRATFAALLCLLISILTNVDLSMILSINDVGGKFKISRNLEFASRYSILASFAHLRTTIRLLMIPVLIVLNLLLLRYYKMRMKERLEIASNNNVDSVTKRALEEEDKSRTLMILVICHSLTAMAETAALTSSNLATYAYPTIFASCNYYLFSAISNSVLQVAEILDFYLVLAVNPRFRRMTWQTVMKNCGNEGLASTSVSTGGSLPNQNQLFHRSG